MVPVREQNVDPQVPERTLLELRCGLDANEPYGSRRLALPPPRAPARTPPKPCVRCGWCHAVVDNLGVQHTTRCRQCQRALTVPSRVRVACSRCGHSEHIRPRELATERCCSQCGLALVAGDLLLTSRRGRHATHHRRHSSPSGSHADAAWTVVVVALTVLITVIALTL